MHCPELERTLAQAAFHNAEVADQRSPRIMQRLWNTAVFEIRFTSTLFDFQSRILA